jgi:hypothetical protein
MSIDQRTVVALTALWLVLIAPYPLSLDGFGVPIVLAIVTLDVILGVRTGWLALGRAAGLDERETDLRDRAFRLAFHLIAIGIATMIVTGVASSLLRFLVAHQPSSTAIPDPIGVRGIVALLELLAFAPTAVIAWFQPHPHERPLAGGRSRWLALLAVPLAGALWLVGVITLPQRTATVHLAQAGLVMADASCSAFGVRRETAFGFGGALHLEATVCWNGRQAFVVGDTSLPRPASLPDGEYAGLAMGPSLTSCRPLAGDDDFAAVQESCSETIDQDGTMHYVLRGQVWPAALAGGPRQTIELVVAADGRVLRFG